MDALESVTSNPLGRWLMVAGALAVKFTVVYLVVFAVYHFFNLHGRFGIFKHREPEVHFRTAMRNWKIPFIWAVGITLGCTLFGLNLAERGRFGRPELTFAVPPEIVVLRSPNLLTDLLYAVVGFYLLDLANYWSHRLNHVGVLYTKFPFAHFVHHNCVFTNPTVTYSSPFIHLSAWTGLMVYVAMLSQGLLLPVAIMHVVRTLSGWTSHLGFDPFPWLSRLNHRVGGWIPWIPLHHQYHHLPFVRGNYGNITCLWDYVFGTLAPECAAHLESGAPLPEVTRKLDEWELHAGEFYRGKTGLSLPERGA